MDQSKGESSQSMGSCDFDRAAPDVVGARIVYAQRQLPDQIQCVVDVVGRYPLPANANQKRVPDLDPEERRNDCARRCDAIHQRFRLRSILIWHDPVQGNRTVDHDAQ